MRYEAIYKLAPTGIFGLPDGDFVVVPAGPERRVYGGTLDTRTGQIVGHGSLSEYRTESARLHVQQDVGICRVSVTDNYVTVSGEFSDAATGLRELGVVLDVFTQGLGVHVGEVVSAELVSLTDAAGKPQTEATPAPVRMLHMRAYNLDELKKVVSVSFGWAAVADDRARKSLYYFESSLLLRDYARSLTFGPTHRSFATAMAFLQLFKALVAIIGEPKVDRDYQGRANALGLAPRFWDERVRPYYQIRSDEDVAHYSLEPVDDKKIEAAFSGAFAAFREALTAHMGKIVPRGD